MMVVMAEACRYEKSSSITMRCVFPDEYYAQIPHQYAKIGVSLGSSRTSVPDPPLKRTPTAHLNH